MPELVKGPIPLWYQLENILRKQIVKQDIQPNALMPTEMELCELYGVSRATVRQAIKALEDDGLIKREQGRGTTVLPDNRRERQVKLFGSIDDILALGSVTRLEFTSRRLVPPSARMIQEAGLTDAEKHYLYKAKRYFKPKTATDSSDECFAIIHFLVPRQIGNQITLKQVKARSTLIGLIEQVVGVHTYRIRQAIGAMAATEALAAELNVDVGVPVLRMKRVYLDNNDTLLESAISYVAEPSYQFETEMVMSAS